MTNLICLPYAGGDATVYNCMKEFIHPCIRFLPLELPGRRERFSEALLTDIHRMVDDYLLQMAPCIKDPFMIFGHSMGALIGFLITRKLRLLRKSMPQHLFVSGFSGPSVAMTESRKYMPGKEELINRLSVSMEVPDTILYSEAFSLIYEPILSADLKIFKSYIYTMEAPLNVPITVFIGKEDDVTLEEAVAWSKETTKVLTLHTYEGGHHFWKNCCRQLVEIMNNYAPPNES